MEEDLKQLLLKDLAARLPYGVVCQFDDGRTEIVTAIYEEDGDFICELDFTYHREVSLVKPILRPMSSMTEEEVKDFQNCKFKYNTANFASYVEEMSIEYDWLNAHHFDHRGLIKQGLAIEVNEENNPYKD